MCLPGLPSALPLQLEEMFTKDNSGLCWPGSVKIHFNTMSKCVYLYNVAVEETTNKL